ncbi:MULTISPECIES: formate dehydrogenase accessory sulfurtransferase FdhD [unclassified Janthinobacterium]|uniref:formate dehydrogenase accessory sulfurtransferase FdhD n=1 Tax=unclassified Janthinobacterium TaxID=2610881 RepID=UPI001E583B61|nr:MULTISPECIES: formate dehydrogenase accessory sulfurtransferase FdhD [unclassified Janthinobacterium]MCC7644075.1 formate dehydrogenase accessory sulfurtransferase FdhD [Janthinobacterium sp. EB271-G4-3-1]MCC7692168.1 formate dehydrogenase accessory sulfurtransferase FdhD [Janthinobacterium sp. EB271-G4-3-2]
MVAMTEDTEIERAGFVERAIVRHQAGAATPAIDRVAEEIPVALVFNGISHVVMMATPRDLEAFAYGFALTEGVVASADAIFDCEVFLRPDSAEVALRIAQEDFVRLKDRRRQLTGRTGCGVCGIDSIEMLDLQPAPLPPSLIRVDLPAALARASAGLREHQTLMRETGGVHAAAWCTPDGDIVHVFEDVGRHNGLDKLIGHLALSGADMRRGFVFLSSRGSYELARKAARMRIPLLATISAPSSLAISIATQAGMKLAGFCRQDAYVDYTPGVTL